MNTLIQTQVHYHSNPIISNLNTDHDFNYFPSLPKIEDVDFISIPKTKENLKKTIQSFKLQNNKTLGIKLCLLQPEFRSYFLTCIEEEIDFVVFEDGFPLDVLKMLPPDLVKITQTKFVIKLNTRQEAFMITEHWQKTYHLLPDAFMIKCKFGNDELIKVSDLFIGSTVS